MKRLNAIKILSFILFIFFCFVFINIVQADIPQEAEIHNQMGNDYCERGKFENAILESKKLVPSWRRICKTLLRNDYWCKGLSFNQHKTEAYKKYLELKKKKRKEDGFSL